MASKVCNKLLWSTIGLLHLLAAGVYCVELGLRFTEEPSGYDGSGALTALRGATLTLNCTAQSAPELGEVQYMWLRDGAALSIKHSVLDGDLHLRRMARKMEGAYQCAAHNSAGSIVSRPITVNVAQLERFTAPAEDVALAVEAGQVARLQCTITGVPAPRLSWERDKQHLPANPRHTDLGNGVLQIREVSAVDSGKYRCLAKNIARVRRSAEITLTVTSTDGANTIPHLIQGVENQSVSVGSTAVLECAATGSPTPTISWTLADGSAVEGDRFTLLGGSNLQIHNIQEADEGVYVCNVQSSSGTVTSQGRLTVMAPPVIRTELKSLYRVSSTTIRFQCDIQGKPKPSVWWTRNGDLIEHKYKDRYKLMNQGSVLVISQVVVEDSGYFQCWGKNDAGITYQSARLHITQSLLSPEAPTDLVARHLSSESIELTWTESEAVNGFTILAYSVHYLPTKGGAELQKVTRYPKVVINNLKPQTNYTFYVMAYNNEGASRRSEKVTEVTSEDYPLRAPAISLAAAGANSLLVKWDELPPEEARGKITKYRIIYRQHGEGNTEHVDLVDGSVREHIITALEANIKYDVCVLPGTEVGFPRGSTEQVCPWISQVTDPTRTTGVPEPVSMSVQVLNSTAVLVTWDKVAEIGAKTMGYHLYVFERGESKHFKYFILVDETRKLVTKLSPSTWYEIKLNAFNSLGDGKPTVRVIQTNNVDGSKTGNDGSQPVPPPPPSIIEAEPLNATAIRLSWHVPSVYDVLTYTVQYQPVVEDSSYDMVFNGSWVRSIQSASTEVTLTDLQAYIMYSFSIKSHTEEASGDFSHEVRCRTKATKPSEPVHPQVHLEGNTVRLFWSPPIHPNGALRNYIISYTKDPNENQRHWSVKVVNGSTTLVSIPDLSTGTNYFFKVQASTSVGVGPSSPLVNVHVPGNEGGFAGLVKSERDMGIIAGGCIGGGCFIICAIILAMRNRLCPPPASSSPPPTLSTHYNGNGSIPHGNGNGTVQMYDSVDYHEMDSMMPLTILQENEDCDTKGGEYGTHGKGRNGKVNGLNGLNGLSVHQNGVRPVPNGHRIPRVSSESEYLLTPASRQQRGTSSQHDMESSLNSSTLPSSTDSRLQEMASSEHHHQQQRGSEEAGAGSPGLHQHNLPPHVEVVTSQGTASVAAGQPPAAAGAAQQHSGAATHS